MQTISTSFRVAYKHDAIDKLQGQSQTRVLQRDGVLLLEIILSYMILWNGLLCVECTRKKKMFYVWHSVPWVFVHVGCTHLDDNNFVEWRGIIKVDRVPLYRYLFCIYLKKIQINK